MKKISLYILLASSLCLMASCGSKKADNEASQADSISTSKPAAIASDPQWNNQKSVKWNGHDYQITLKRTPAHDLPVVTDELGQRYYDNRVEVTITRDGAPFYNKKFTKEAFIDFISDKDIETGILQGIAFDDVDNKENGLRFGAQVGVPGEDGIPFVIIINSEGMASITKDNVLDTSAQDTEEE